MKEGAYVVGKDVEWAVVRVCFLFKSVPEVVFSDKVACAWMETSREEARHDEVDEGFRAEQLDEYVVEDELSCDVPYVP